MDPNPPIGNPLESWLPFQIAFLVGLLVCIRTYMKGPECPSKATMKGKTVVITGANTGIGKETALDLARRGGRIILACRNTEQAEIAAAEIKTTAVNNDVHVMKLDLASFKSVREFAKLFCSEYSCLDVLINNAAVMLCPFSKTEDGFEQHFQVNYLSHFLLTNLLLDKLKAAPSGGRVINVSALAHKAATLNLDDLNSETAYVPREAYGQSKLAVILGTIHFSKVLKDTNVIINALHPGIVKETDILRHTTIHKSFLQTLATPLTWLLLKTPKDGAQTSIYLAVGPELNTVTGKYFSDCEAKKLTPEVDNEDLAKQLWEVSQKLIAL